LTEDRLRYYRPYEKQLAFHKAGASHRERLLMAGNQLGKTLAGGFEVAMHATGRYADWWQGKRFDKPTVGWACGVTGEVVRDTVQKVLVGRTGQTPSGSIMSPVVCPSSDSRPTLQAEKNSKVKRLTMFGLMKSRQATFSQKH
jgi:Terminase large subunit, T4likevirus-type, N-terminal